MATTELDALVEQLAGDYVLRVETTDGQTYTLLDPIIGERWVSGFTTDAHFKTPESGEIYIPTNTMKGKERTYFLVANILWMRATESKREK